MMTIQERFAPILKADLPLAPYSSFKIGGCADLAAFPQTEDALISLLRLAKAENVRTLLVGNATNLLFHDNGFRGLVIFTTAMKEVHWQENEVTAAAGASLTALAAEAGKRSLGGLEFAYGIPGTVGGGVYMNAGAYGGELSNVLTESRFFDGEEIRTRTADKHAFGYRKSIYMETGEIILSAHFRLTPGDGETIRKKANENMASRKAKQPLELPNAGSTFKRPEGHFAGALIEQSGLKGFSVGGAAVSEKHAGFVVNKGDATAEDVRRLIAHIQNEIFRRFGVALETEVIQIDEQ